MRGYDGYEELAEAAELLTMLQDVIKSYADTSQATSSVPWRAFQLSLGQSRSRIERAMERFSEGENNSARPVESGRPRDNSLSRAAVPQSVAGRVTRAPTAVVGTVRELHSTADIAQDSQGGNQKPQPPVAQPSVRQQGVSAEKLAQPKTER